MRVCHGHCDAVGQRRKVSYSVPPRAPAAIVSLLGRAMLSAGLDGRWCTGASAGRRSVVWWRLGRWVRAGRWRRTGQWVSTARCAACAWRAERRAERRAARHADRRAGASSPACGWRRRRARGGARRACAPVARRRACSRSSSSSTSIGARAAAAGAREPPAAVGLYAIPRTGEDGGGT